jgi:hypothetical protein
LKNILHHEDGGSSFLQNFDNFFEIKITHIQQDQNLSTYAMRILNCISCKLSIATSLSKVTQINLQAVRFAKEVQIIYGAAVIESITNLEA